MNSKPIIVVAGEPYSIFLEIFFKSFNIKKIKKPIILIVSKGLFLIQMKKLGFNFGIQGMQFTATSTTAESQTLSNSMYVHSIPNNNDNQDIVSMGTNSASMAQRVIDNSFQVTSIHLMAICQAIDLLKNSEKEKLSANTLKVHKMIRDIAPFAKKDNSHSKTMNEVYNFIKNNKFTI